MSDTELTWLAKQAMHCSLIVEVGCFIGRSTRALVDHTEGVVIAVDSWDPVTWLEQIDPVDPPAGRLARTYPQPFLTFIHHLRGCPNLLIHRGTLQEVQLPWMPDMVFLDGDHRYHAVRADILAAQRLLAPGGILCGHDYHSSIWPDVTRAVDDFVGPVRTCESIWWRPV